MGQANQNKQTCALIHWKRRNKHSNNVFLEKKRKKMSLSCAVFTFFQVHSLLTYETTISERCLKKRWRYRGRTFLEEKGHCE